MPGLRPLWRLVARAGWRLRANRALGAAFLWAPAGLLGLCLLVVARRLGPSAASWTPVLNWVGWAGVGLWAAPVLGALLRPQPWLRVSLELDARLGMGDRLTNALCFGGSPRRSPLMTLAIEDARRLVEVVELSRLFPLRRPRPLWPTLACLAALAATLSYSPPPTRSVRLPKVPKPSVDYRIDSDDLSLLRTESRKLKETARSPEQQRAIAELERWVADLQEQRLPQDEAFRRLASIEALLDEGSAQLDQLRGAALMARAEALQGSGLLRSTAKSLTENQPSKAARELEKLAKKLEAQTSPPNRAELAELRKAMQRLAELRAENQQRDAPREKNQPKGAPSPSAKDEGRSLPGAAVQPPRSLDSTLDAAQRVERELSELDRSLLEAAKELLEGHSDAARGFQQAAQQLDQLELSRLTEEQKRAWLERLRAMKDVLRDPAGHNAQRRAQKLEFATRAHGRDNGQATLAVPIPAGSRGASSGPEQGRSSPTDSPGAGAGTEHDPSLLGDPTRRGATPVDLQVTAADTGQDTVSVDVVADAAYRGFAGSRYQRAYREYESVAETNLAQPQVPPGVRSRVRRYFQLIRPRP